MKVTSTDWAPTRDRCRGKHLTRSVVSWTSQGHGAAIHIFRVRGLTQRGQ